MKHFSKFTIGLACSVALSLVVRADTFPISGNPYALVVARNIFGLLPPPPPPDPNATAEAPVKITPNGIMSISGLVKVLFKVAGKTPGKEDSYMLTEGQGQDDIDVLKIDEKNGLVTFNNHGIQQILPLAAAANTMPAPTAAGGGPGIPGMRSIPAPGGNAGASGFNNVFGGRSASGRNNFGANNPGANNGLNPASSASSPGSAASQIPAGMTPDVQTVAIEVNRELTKQQVINGELPPLPITDMTPADAVGPGGVPLAAPAANMPPQ